MSHSQKQFIQGIIKKAEQIRLNSKTSCVNLENLLYYQKMKLSKQSSSPLLLCGCEYDKSIVKTSFKRAYKTLTDIQKAEYYLKCCQYISDFINGTGEYQQQGVRTSYGTSLNCDYQNQVIRKMIQIKVGGAFSKWIGYNAEINLKEKIIKIIELREEIDLHYFIMRNSKNKSKGNFILEATQQGSQPQTYRISAQNECQYQQLEILVRELSNSALREKIIRMMIQEKKYPKKGNENKSSKLKLMKNPYQPQPISLRLTKDDKIESQKQILRAIQEAEKNRQFNEEIYDKISEKLLPRQYLLSLNSFSGFEQIKANVFHEKKGLKVRRIFTFKNQQIPNIQWLLDQMLNTQGFSQWKPSLQFIQLLNQFPAERSFLFHEIDYYKNQMEIEYVYLRHYTFKQDNHYFIDRSTPLKINSKVSASKKGQVKQVVWRFRQLFGNVQILVEAQVDHGIKNEKQIRKMTEQFIGEFLDVLNCKNSSNCQHFENQNQILVNTLDFQKEYLSEIGDDDSGQFLAQRSKNNDICIQDGKTEFFSLSGSYLSNNKSVSRNFSKGSISPLSPKNAQYFANQRRNKFENIKFSFVKQNSQQSMTISNHLVNPLKPTANKNLLKSQKGHFIWQDQWRINNDGSLVNINIEKIKVQSSVLKLVLKRMGQNLIQGKNIMNTSLPIQLFDQISLLQRFSICMGYGPIFLEKAACKNSLQRFKATVSFAVGFNICFIQMQKAFNPLLGETFQGIIDGCPVYAEQISHHPPISSLFFKGRKFTVSGSLQPKIQMGLKTVCGKNDGLLKVFFQDKEKGKSQVKFQTVPGQLSGLVYGERELKFTQSTIFFDVQNSLFCEIKWGRANIDDQMSIFQDYLFGQLFQVDKQHKFAKGQQRPKKKFIKKMLGTFHGRWTDKVYFDNELIFNVNEQAPCLLEQYPIPLQSDSNNRKDIKFRKQNMWNDAQDAKSELQELQRYDKKLRKK